MSIDQFAGEIVNAANAKGIDPAALLAVVEIETNGVPFEADKKTPRFLFERHVFYSQLKSRAPERLSAAVAQDLAHSGWQGRAQYFDERTSPERQALLARARGIDMDCANRSCSWGLGQIMGFNANELGYASAEDMLSYMIERGVTGQIDVMIKFIEHKGLIEALNRKDWPKVALFYNGKEYRKNDYDNKLAKAYARWAATLASGRVPSIQAAQVTALARPAAAAPSPEEAALQLLIEALLKPQTAAAPAPVPSGAAGPDMLQSILELARGKSATAHPAAPAPAPSARPPVVLSPIDKMLGGEALAGKKTALAVVAYVILAVLQAAGVIGVATPTGQILTVLITAFGSLGGLSKIDRVISALGAIAARPMA